MQSETTTAAGVSGEYSLFDDTDTLLPKIGAIAFARKLALIWILRKWKHLLELARRKWRGLNKRLNSR